MPFSPIVKNLTYFLASPLSKAFASKTDFSLPLGKTTAYLKNLRTQKDGRKTGRPEDSCKIFISVTFLLGYLPESLWNQCFHPKPVHFPEDWPHSQQ